MLQFFIIVSMLFAAHHSAHSRKCPSNPVVVPCDTDSDCVTKNPCIPFDLSTEN